MLNFVNCCVVLINKLCEIYLILYSMIIFNLSEDHFSFKSL